MRKQATPKFNRRSLMATGATVMAGGTLGSLGAAANDAEVYQIEEPTGVAWRYDGPYDTAVANGDRIYVLANGVVSALNAVDGSVEWETDDSGGGGLSVEDGTVFAGDPMRAIDADTGEVRWESEISNRRFVVGHGLVYTQAEDSVYALDAEDGSIQWEQRSITVETDDGEYITEDLQLGDIGEESLYTFDSSLIIGLDPTTGETEVTVNVAATPIEEYPSVDSISAAGSGHVAYRREDIRTVGLLITIATKEGMGNPNVFDQTIIGDTYFSLGDAGFGVYDLSSEPEHVWGYGPSVTVGIGLPTVVGDTVVATHSAGAETMGDQNEDRVMAFDLESGEEQWRYTFDETDGLALVDADENTVYVSRNEELLALRTEQETDEEPEEEGEGASVQAEIIDFNSSGGTVEPGDEMTSTTTVENTGDAEHTFFVGYSVVGPDGETYYDEGESGSQVTLNPGEQTTVDVAWTATASAPTGTYDTLTVIWKENDRSNLETQLDNAENTDAFELEEASIQAEIVEFESAGGTVEPSDEMASTITVENTGTTDHTFFIGYSVIAPDGSEFYTAGETGTTVTLEAGERTDIEVSWEVTPAAPPGSYDAYGVVWEESDRSELETQLDSVTESEVFEVDPGSQSDEFSPALHGFGFPNWAGEEGCSTDSDPCPEGDQFTIERNPIDVETARQAIQEWSINLRQGVSEPLARIVQSELECQQATNGHSYGMASAAQRYFKNPSQLPGDIETASEISSPTGDSSEAGNEIRDSQQSQLLSSAPFWVARLSGQVGEIDTESAWEELTTAIDENGTAGVTLSNSESDSTHQVLTYHYEETETGIEFFVYDPNDSAQTYQVEGDQYDTPARSFVVDSESGEPIDNYDDEYDLYAYTDPDLSSESTPIISNSVDDLLSSLRNTAIFQLRSSGTLTIDGADSSTVVHPEAEFEHSDPLSDFAYIANVDSTDYEITVTGENENEYTLDAFGFQDGEMILEESVSDSITGGEEHEFTISLQETAEESGIQRTGASTQSSSNDGESENEFPIWLPVVGGATSIIAASVGAYTYLSQKNKENGENHARDEDRFRSESENQTDSELEPPPEQARPKKVQSDEQIVPSRSTESDRSQRPDETCHQCGIALLDDAQFCHECGSPLNRREEEDYNEK